ncbi:MAG: hypothetical protein WDN30_10405 [Pararobbsia sp.]
MSPTTDIYLQGTYQHIASDGSGLTADVTAQTPSSTDRQVVVGTGMRHKF